jgi:hypothetical protein
VHYDVRRIPITELPVREGDSEHKQDEALNQWMLQ